MQWYLKKKTPALFSAQFVYILTCLFCFFGGYDTLYVPLMRVAAKLLSLFKDCWYTHVRYCYNLSQVVLGYPGIMIPGTILGGSMPGEPVDPGILRFPRFLG